MELFGEVAALKQMNSELREEVARHKGLKGRPRIGPSGMDKGTEPPKPDQLATRRGRGKVTPRVSIEEQVLNAPVPPGSRFKGYEPILVQDLVISARATCYQRERRVTPDGRTVLVPLPEGIEGHFGPELRRFVLMQYHHGQSTLRASHTDYVLNDAAYGYMRDQNLPATTIARLMADPEKRFNDPKAWLAHLDRLGLTALSVTPDPVRVASEGALWGSVQSHKFLCDAVVLSDDAGQFEVGRHVLCWVHAERLVHKLDTFTDKQRAAQKRVRGLIWKL